MDLREHMTFTETTAFYPQAGTGSVAALTYVALGLMGEASEVLQKELESDSSGVVLELGDVAWYQSRFHRELGLDPYETMKKALSTGLPGAGSATALVVAAGRVGELVKKAVRDDASQLSDERRDALAGALVALLHAWLAVHTKFVLDAHETLLANATKIASRAQRGVLAGSGDYR